jgi:hypothetical protein
MWSNASSGWIGVLIAVIFLFVIQEYLVKKANEFREHHKDNEHHKDKLTLFDLIVTSEDNRFSLSRFQIYVWTVWVVIAFAAIAFYTCSFPTIPSNLAILMGINGLTAVLSTAITDPEKIKTKQRSPSPSFYKDIFLDKNETLDLPRTQMFIWTIIILTTHIFVFWHGYYTVKSPSLPTLPDVDSGLLILMGVSNGAYLGVKATDK